MHPRPLAELDPDTMVPATRRPRSAQEVWVPSWVTDCAPGIPDCWQDTNGPSAIATSRDRQQRSEGKTDNAMHITTGDVATTTPVVK